MRLLRLNFLIAAIAGCAATTYGAGGNPISAPSPVHPPFSVADADRVIPALAKLLIDNYVFPDTGMRYAAMLESNLAAGRYKSFGDAGAFAETVTADLQNVSPDRHLVLIAPRTDRPSPGSKSNLPSDSPPPLGKSGWIAPGVAYLEFHSFPSDSATLAKLGRFLSRHAHARILILDLVHEHSGGWIGEADLLFKQLYASPTDLVTIDVRDSVDKRTGGLAAASIRKIGSPPGVVRYVHSVVPARNATLTRTRVYVLISHQTISAGEHLAFALQRSHRATLIGERTRGAGHVESEFQLSAGYSAVIPFARAFDPRTGEEWEGTGVTPDIAVPADEALDKALRLAGVRANAKVALSRLR